MAGSLAGKSAIVTGGTSGIGARTVELFAAAGATVLIAARRATEGNALAARLGPNVEFLTTDVSDEDQVRRLINTCVDRHGRLDCLFNNAGNPGKVCGIEETTVSDLDAILRVHLRGVMLGMKHAAPVMRAQRSGSIVNTASLAGSRPGFSAHTYSAAKAAIIHLTRCVAVELGEHGIRVNSLSPGPTVTGIFGKKTGSTDAVAEQTQHNLLSRFAELQPIPRACLPEDIARAAVFLASDASSFISGKDLVVDGGNVGGWRWPVLMANWEEARQLTAAAG